ncbi:hypothetical protein GCM10009117_08850 [Gangjinia marincola]|uniref:Uncharacterized protein n=2 Tax=Gangjinia marincola TaxID=578463 RepID=A0ABP3XTR6_9FLAO
MAFVFLSCEDESDQALDTTQWKRETAPVLRDSIDGINYQVASDPHVFMENGTLNMIYTGDADGIPSIKLATGNALNNWTIEKTLLGSLGPSGLDIYKETGFYRKSSTGKHQIYYIGYNDEDAYESQIFLAEADELEGPYVQQDAPLVSKGLLAGKNVYSITSPSVVEHEGKLYMAFIGWNDSPENVTEVWIIGATSTDQGHSWSDFQLVDTRIGMEGQVTKTTDNRFIAVRTGEYEDKEAIFYSSALHPFGPWMEKEDPILIQAGAPFEKDQIIAPQIFIVPETGEEILFYTGADQSLGWWVMMARE